MQTEVVVIGAGVAGLSAAAVLRQAGTPAIVLEATSRIGGRARTVRGGALGDASFDLGASWLHAAERNPLARIAEAHGDEVRTSGERARLVFVDGYRARDAELAAFDASWERFEAEACARATEAGPDVSVAEAIASLRGDPWTATVEFWEASLIAAADSAELSVRDWHRNLLTGANLVVAGGVGAFVERRLGPPSGEIWLQTPATRIEWNGAGGTVRVDTARGAITARACIVTVSTGVLAAGTLGFSPRLPSATEVAVAGLPMGLLNKVALRATGHDRLDLPPGCSVQQLLPTPGADAMSFHAWPDGADHVVGFVGGAQAWDLARLGDAALGAFALERLREMLGSRASQALAPACVGSWGTDPATLGAYAYARPGHADARGVLGTPIGDGHLVFAGEAVCTDGLAGTVGGAWLSGRAAAHGVLGVLARASGGA